MNTLILLTTAAFAATLSLAQDFCACYTATTTLKPLFCGRDTDICFDVNDSYDTPTATVTVPPHHPMCLTTPTVTSVLPCCGGGCPVSTETVTARSICRLNDGHDAIAGRDLPPLTPQGPNRVLPSLINPTDGIKTIFTAAPMPKQLPPAAFEERDTAPLSPLATKVPTGSVPTGFHGTPCSGLKTLVTPSLAKQQTQPPLRVADGGEVA